MVLAEVTEGHAAAAVARERRDGSFPNAVAVVFDNVDKIRCDPGDAGVEVGPYFGSHMSVG